MPEIISKASAEGGDQNSRFVIGGAFGSQARIDVEREYGMFLVVEDYVLLLIGLLQLLELLLVQPAAMYAERYPLR